MKRMLALFLLVCMMCTCATFGLSEGASGLTVWAIESAQITDYQTNGQSIWFEGLTGVPVTWISTPRSGWYRAFQASVMSGEKVDIYLYDFDTSEASMLGAEMEYIIPLEDYITAENTPNIHAILEADPDLRELITAPDGHIYTLFTNNAYDLGAVKQKLWVNRHFYEKYTAETGCGLPETTVEFEAMLQYFATHDMNGDGVINEIPYIGRNGVDGMYNLFGSFLPANSNSNAYGCYINDAGVLCFSYTADEFKDALAYVQNLYAQGLISPDTFTISSEERYIYTSGSRGSVRAGVVADASVAQVVQLSNEPDAMTYTDYIPLPPLEGPNGVRTITSSGETLVALRNAITIHCEDPLTAMKWLDAGYSETARMYAVYGGLEGVDWKYVEGENLNGIGCVIISENGIKENETWNGQGIVYRITEEDYLSMDVSQLPTSDALCTYRANVAYRPYMIKNPWPAIVWPGEHMEEAAQYSELINLIQPTVTTFYTDVILGRKNLDDDWDAYMDELNTIGLEHYVDLVHLYIDIGDKQ